MKKIILTLSLVMFITLAWSQGQRKEGKRPEKPSSEQMIKQASKELSLTDSQVDQWKNIHEKYESSLANQSKAHEARQSMGKELEATLTEEQLEKFKKMRKGQGPPKGGN
jgi:Spy/CpxP family protein refolding chaperone